MYKDFTFPYRFKMVAVLWVFLAVAVKRLDRLSRNWDFLDIFLLLNFLELFNITEVLKNPVVISRL